MSTNPEHDELAAILAGLGDAAGLDEDLAEGLGARLPRTRRRIRRRRAVKVAGIGAGTVAVSSAFAVGALASPWRASVVPAPPATPTPTQSTQPSPSAAPTPTESASPSPTPTDEPSAESTPTPSATPGEPAATRTALDDPRFAEGWKLFPNTGTASERMDEIACGDPVTELLDLPNESGLRISLLSVGTETSEVRITNEGAETFGPGNAAMDPELVWVQDGRIVDGEEREDAGDTFTRDDGSSVSSLPPGSSFTTQPRSLGDWECGTRLEEHNGPFDAFPDTLPPGEYEVYALALFAPRGEPFDYEGVTLYEPTPFSHLVSNPVTVTLE